MKDYMLEQYEDYMANHCTCDRCPEECTCLSYENFCLREYEKCQEEWALIIAEEQCAYQEYAECQN